ncbi:MAG: hypothetical protein CSA33_04465 [Desulfobulbus propionicus]|nr:MAG: hypothetical protein CSA33_04465 [Desulfobulbus propionicus]
MNRGADRRAGSGQVPSSGAERWDKVPDAVSAVNMELKWKREGTYNVQRGNIKEIAIRKLKEKRIP